ncbi:Translation factor GUF1 homolog, mitochondrial [Gryllus bimaculatus]|nr:Translation factor GUF1 homolog, mitochondrial [Gryllus bimaculatus]
MGKAKKGKKGNKEDEIDDDIEVEPPTVIDDNAPAKGKEKKAKVKVKDEENIEDDDDEDATSKKKKGKKEKKKKKEDEDLDEIVKELEDTHLDKSKKEKKQNKKSKGDSSEEEEVKPSQKNVKSKKKGTFSSLADDDSDEETDLKPSRARTTAKKGGFALLAMEDEGDSGSDDAGVNTKDSDDEDKVSNKAESKKGKKVVRTDSLEDDVKSDRTKDSKNAAGGKKSKKKKKQDDDEEDIEKVLAELEMEYSGVKQEEVPQEVAEKKTEEEEDGKKSKKKKKKEKEENEVGDGEEGKRTEVIDGEEIESTVKSAAQKKKEKKEREKQKKMEQKKKETGPAVAASTTPAPTSAEPPVSSAVSAPSEPAATPAPQPDGDPAAGGDEAEGDDKKKKKKKKGKEEEPPLEKGKKAGPGKKAIAAMQEALRKVREEEERLAREEEERLKKIEEAERLREEQKRLEIERKEKKKQKEKERRERLKAEGKLLTPKQKEDRRRAQAMLEARLAEGLEMPAVAERKFRPGTRIRPNKKQQQQQQSQEQETKDTEKKVEVEIVDTAPAQQEKVEEKKEEEDVKDTWDADSSEDEDEDKSEVSKTGTETQPAPVRQKSQEEEEDDDEDEEEESSDSGSDSEEESSEEESDSEDEHKTDAQRRRERALARIQKRREDAEKNKTVEVLRAAVVCVLGHVDTGKTKILDKLRRTNVQDGEAGGITQQIGATNVPIEAIKEQTKIVKGFSEIDLRIPGLLIIDTPGHESFSNLRSRGSSLCDIAILVVDIMHGLEPQTIESINLLKTKKTPFIVALNKIDRLYDWQTMSRKDIQDVIKGQAANTQLEFEQRTKEVIVQFAEQGLNAALFYENPDVRSYVSLVPTSAITGEGMGNLLALIVQSCQNMLAKRLMYSEELQATVLEVKAIPGLGTTIDAILVNGKLREGDTMVLAGTDGPIVTQIRSLLMPQPMKELRVKNAYVEYKEIMAAQGVKIAGKELEKAIAGLNLLVAQKPDEVEICREEVARELKHALSNIKLQERGVYVQASTLGSLEALLEFLRTSKIPYANIRIGPVVKKDVMKASTMLEHESQYATILAFDVKVERDAQELADTLGVKIFQADIIYHLFDKFMAYREELKQRKRDEFKHIAVFPCKLKVLPQFIFNSRDPIVMGVMVEAGIVREGTPICVPSREFVELGVVTSIESNHKTVESARKGQEVCIKIEPIPGEAPKMFGRHFDEKDFLVSKISRQSIDACKDYFRDDLIKTDWQLMVELKKLFQIL